MSIEAMKRVLRYDPETGEFWWTAEAPTKVAGKMSMVQIGIDQGEQT